MKRSIRIANAGGYWGDDLGAMRRQLLGGPVDYITQDFLAEITMSILQKQRRRDPSLGYAADFVRQMEENLPLIVKKGVRVISSAGGIHPVGCARRVQEAAKRLGLKIRVGVVHGDDVLGRLDVLERAGEKLRNMETGESYANVRGRVTSANAYLGAAPVVKALEAGCQVVVTGRVTDTGITLAPMLHEFGWPADDWDRIAAGIVAGHIIECGAQASGGNLTDWRDVPSFDRIGYPIVEVEPSGEFVVTKHPRLGGLVSEKTVKEQLLYEMGDPSSYLTPDGTARFDTIRVKQEGRGRVRVSGIQGEPHTPFFKVSMSYDDGWKASGSILVCGPDAGAKAEAFAKLFWKRLGRTYEHARVERLGTGSIWPASLGRAKTHEILLRFGVRDRDKDKVRAFGVMLPSVILSGPSGAAVTGGRPRPEQVVAYWPTLIRRDRVDAKVTIVDPGGRQKTGTLRFSAKAPAGPRGRLRPSAAPGAANSAGGRLKTVKLRRIAYARSGDKGDVCNIGVAARSEAAYAWLVRELTGPRVKGFFKGIVRGRVRRHRVDNLLALNFLMDRTLGGGGTRSLMIDPQGKTLSQALLEMPVRVPGRLLRRS